MTKVLITGANGQLGKTLRELGDKEAILEVTYTDFEELDITNAREVNEFFRLNQFDFCVNCAAYTAVDKAEEEVDKCFSINAHGVVNLSEACKKNQIILIQISTDFIFNGDKITSYTTKDLPDPISVYGSSKLKGENYVKNILKDYFIIRTSWVFSEHGNNFVKTMLRIGSENKSIRVVDDQLGSPTYAKDLAGFILFLITQGHRKFGIFHFSNVGTISWCDFAKEIFRITDTSVSIFPIPTELYPTPAKRPKFSSLDLTQTIETFGIKIRPWQESLEECLSKLGKQNILG